MKMEGRHWDGKESVRMEYRIVEAGKNRTTVVETIN
jgi:hypothetical protein